MGLMRALQRWRYVYGWRLRYWWLDTKQGEEMHWALVVVSAIVIVYQVARMALVALAPPQVTEQKAVYWWVIQLIIMIVAAAIAYAMRPKPEVPKPASGDPPTTEDGQYVKDYLGTCWVDNFFILAWKVVGTVPIKSKGGK